MFLSKKISYLQVYIFVCKKANLNHCSGVHCAPVGQPCSRPGLCPIDFSAQNSASMLKMSSKLKNIGLFRLGMIDLHDFINC